MVMAKVQGEKNLAASVNEMLVDEFWATVPDGFKNKHVLTAAAKIWLSIPEEDRLLILMEQKKGGNIESLYITGNCLNGIFSGHFTLENNAQIILAPIPEPCTLLLLLTGFMTISRLRRKQTAF